MGGGGSAPQPPKFHPIDIPGAIQAAQGAQKRSFELTDEDFLKRFPGLVAGNKLNIESASESLFGPLDKAAQNQMATRSIEQALGATGGGDPMASVGGAGSASGNAFALNLADRFTKKQDYDRGAWQQVVGQNPMRDVAVSGSDVANMSLFNTQGQAGSAQANYAAGVQTANQKSAASAQNTQAAIGTALAVLGLVASFASDKRLKKDIKTIGKSPSGVPIKEFSFKGDNKRYVGAIAQDVEKKFPHAVIKDSSGMRKVAYGLTDVPFFQRGGVAA